MDNSFEKPVYTQVWFWLMAIGVLFFGIGVIIYEVSKTLDSSWWVWLFIIGGIIFFILGFFLAVWEWWSREAGVVLDLFPMEKMMITEVANQNYQPYQNYYQYQSYCNRQ